jgi:SAM domain (Sterile alpha motif)
MDIAEWLQDLGLERYAPAFRDNEIDETGRMAGGAIPEVLDGAARRRSAPRSPRGRYGP